MNFIRLTILMVFSILLISCNSMQFGPPRPHKFAPEFLQSKGYSASLIDKVMNCRQMSEAEFDQFGSSEDINVRYMIAINPHIPEPLLTKLAGDREELVRQGVARNTAITTTSINVLKQDYDVQVALVQNCSVPDDVILKIYKEQKIPLDCFADNPNCPITIRRYIVHISRDRIAIRHLKVVDDAKRSGVYVQGKDGRWYKPLIAVGRK